MRLTDIVIRNLPAPLRGQQSYPDEGLAGFSVRVSQGGTKTFYLVHGKDRERTAIGRYPIISLADARIAAKRILAERTLGKHRPTRLKASEALVRFLGEQTEKNRPVTVRYTEALLRNHFPKVLDKNLEDVRTDDITNVTDRLLKKGQPGAANHAFTSVRTFLRWCVKRRYIHHSPIEGIELPSKAGSRERVLTDDELSTVWTAADKIGGHFGDIVKLLILTGQRRSEIGSLKAAWCSLPSSKDGNGGATPVSLAIGGEDTQPSICLPSEITKNRRAHAFPIGALAAAILSSNIKDGTTTLFPARGSTSTPFNGWSKAKAQLDRKALIAPWVLHDLRRSYATNLQRLGIRLEVIEALLNHVSGTRAGIVGVYQRHNFLPEMHAAVALWETHLRTILGMKQNDELTTTVRRP
jgi:integrase